MTIISLICVIVMLITTIVGGIVVHKTWKDVFDDIDDMRRRGGDL